MSETAALTLSLQAIDAELRDAWQRFVALMPPGEPLGETRARFCALGLFPRPVWPVLIAGEALAVQGHDVLQLHGTLQRVLACAHACWGRADSNGLHHGGEDHCAAVTPALYALALGPGYAASLFHEGRELSAKGHVARRNAANLLVLLHHPGWPHGPKALAAARTMVEGTTGNAAARAFVGVLLALATDDAALLERSLPAFADAFTRSDWGRHLPQRQPIVVASLLALAHRHQPAAEVDALADRLLAPERAALWRAHAQALSTGQLPDWTPEGELAFLDNVPGGTAT